MPFLGTSILAHNLFESALRDDALHVATVPENTNSCCTMLHNAKKYSSGNLLPITSRQSTPTPFRGN